MKQFIVAIAVGLLAHVCTVDAQAQFGQKYFTSAHNGKTPTINKAQVHLPTVAPINSDTLTNSGFRDMFINTMGLKDVSVTIAATKVTGTRAAKATLEVSDDGVNWIRARSLYGSTTEKDSVMIADAAGTFYESMTLRNFYNKFLRVHVVGSNTQSTYLRAFATYKP